jgi:cell division protein FtsW
MTIISLIKNKIFKKIIIPIFILSLIMLLLVLFIGIEVKGSKRWLNLFLFRFQPIELLKPFFVVVIAIILSRNSFLTSKISYFYSFIILLVPSVILLNQPDVGQTILLIVTWLATIFISGIELIYIFSLGAFSFLSLIGLFFIFPDQFLYIIRRFEVFFDPTKGDRFQTNQALDAIREGGLTGQGMGEGILKESVPDAHTDYIIAVITEEFGSIVSILLVCIFLYIAFKIIKFTLTAEDKFIKISLCGLASLLMFQTFIHIGVNTSLIPTTGMTLPFVSYGGSSMIGSSVLAGMILNFTKKNYK